MLRIHTVDTDDPRDVMRFIKFPFKLYRGSKYWVPPIIIEAKLQLNRKKHPFYEHSDADFFLALKDGEVVGRLAVLENRNQNEYRKWKLAQFYLFDVIEDFEVAQALFEAAYDWCRKRGLTELLGPKGFLQGDGMGVLIKGFDHYPALGIPYNYPYYGDFMDRLGFERFTDTVSLLIPASIEMPERVVRIAERVKKRGRFWARYFKSKREVRAILDDLVRLYNDTFIENWEYVPITPSEGHVIGERLLAIADLKTSRLLYSGDEMAGFVFAFPNISRAIQKSNGRLFPFGFIRMTIDAARTRMVDLNGAGLLKKYQGIGANAYLWMEIYDAVTSRNRYDYGEAVQVEVGNWRMIHDMITLGADPYKRHRIYIKRLVDDPNETPAYYSDKRLTRDALAEIDRGIKGAVRDRDRRAAEAEG